MNAENFDVAALLKMAHSPVRNYVVPGLTSSLIGAPSAAGTVRLFECEREHQEAITPHSHRFNFQCWVLRGWVRNRVWKQTYPHDAGADKFESTTLVYEGDIGKYRMEPGEVNGWRYRDCTYAEGECYAMESEQVHSIYFSRDAVVLFFEGPKVTDRSVILQPFTGGEVIPTMEVKPWMFKRASEASDEALLEGMPR